MKTGLILAFIMMTSSALHAEMSTTAHDATELIRQVMNHWRGHTSYSEMTMTIHRSDWERSMTMRSWSKGDELSLVRVMEPRKDAGNATLLNDDNMWTYSPKINRVIKVPSSMMSQSWMGSDFSNRDISKSTEIIEQYEHTLTSVEPSGQHTIYTVTAIPHEDAAVVWGKEVLVFRDDFVLLEQQFWDQDEVLVKTLKTTDIQQMGGRSVATGMRMSKVGSPEEWTRITTHQIEFDLELPANLFTLANLRNPRQ